MTQDEKAAAYDGLIRDSEVVTRELSRLQSENVGVHNTTKDYDDKVAFLKNKLLILEDDMKKLFK